MTRALNALLEEVYALGADLGDVFDDEDARRMRADVLNIGADIRMLLRGDEEDTNA